MRARRVAIVAGVLVALYVIVTFLIRTVPDSLVSLLGGPSGGVDRIGGLRVDYRPARGTEAALERYLASRANVRRERGLLVLEFPGLAEDMVSDVTELLLAGGLVMKESLETDYAHEIGASDDVRIEIDQWRSEDNDVRTNAYLEAYNLQALERVVAAAKARGWSVPAGQELAFEAVEGYPGNEDPRPSWRSHLLASEIVIDGSMIANATRAYDPNTNRPIVLLEFTREGGDRFCEITARLVDKKLATMLGGRVRSAPLIVGRICGGRASITMGGSDPRAQEREATALAAVLLQGGLPPGGTIEKQRWTPPANVAQHEWAARLLLGGLVGLGFALVVWLVLRLAAPTWRVASPPVPPAAAGRFPWRRIAVTLLAPVALIAGAKLTLPGVNSYELEFLPTSALGTGASVIALGLTPVMIAFFLVELVALAVPRLRWRRHDPLGRVRLGQAVAVLAVVLALVQGFFIATYLEGFGRNPFGYSGSFSDMFGGGGGGAAIVDHPGWRFRLLVMGSLATGTLLLAVIAGMIREHGLGNGYAVIVVASIAIEILGPYVDEPRLAGTLGRGHVLGLIALAITVLGTACVLRWRIAADAADHRHLALRMPVSGITPLHDTAAILYLVVMISAIGLGGTLDDTMRWFGDLRARPSQFLGLLVLSIPLWGWILARPSLVRRIAMQAGLVSPTTAEWWRAVIVTGVLLATAGVLWIVATRTDGHAGLLAEPVAAMLGVAVALDVIADARAHRQRLAPAAVLHQIQYAGVAERVLADAGIPCHLHASHTRALFAFFGPFIPVVVMVPEALAADAREKLDDALRAARVPVPSAVVVES
ncbi:MAG: hypothetical protein H0T89_06255 [Deltaproteobacteria bacterium]|nr:hypothetical protein [Deltaproteobacteria bacterium]